MLRQVHTVDNFVVDTSARMSVGGKELNGMITKIEWLMDIVK